MTPTKSALTEWLASSLGGYLDAAPIKLTIKGTTYDAAIYHNSHGRQVIYAIGRLPACYRRSSKTLFRFNGEALDWYITRYMPACNLTPENAKFHPFGETFVLMPWNSPDAIDRYEYRPRERVAATLATEWRAL